MPKVNSERGFLGRDSKLFPRQLKGLVSTVRSLSEVLGDRQCILDGLKSRKQAGIKSRKNCIATANVLFR